MAERFQPNGELIPYSFRIVRQDPTWKRRTQEDIKKDQEDPGFVSRQAQRTVKEIDFLLNATRAGLDQRILDLGCGEGRHSRELAKRGYRKVVGVDIHKPSLKSNPEVNFVHADWKHLPFKEKFDVTFMFCSGLSYEGEPSVFKEVSKSLKTGGYFLFDTTDTDEIVNRFHKEGMISETGIYKLKETEIVETATLTQIQFLDLKRQIIYAFARVTDNAIETEEEDSYQLYTIAQHSAMMNNAGLDVENIFSEKNAGKPWYQNTPRAFILARKR